MLDDSLEPATKSEWRKAEETIIIKALAVINNFCPGPEFDVYVATNKGFGKYIYPLAAWVDNPECRFTAGVAFALHCFGIKLLDDIIDRDKPFAPADLIVGSQLCDQAFIDLRSID